MKERDEAKRKFKEGRGKGGTLHQQQDQAYLSYKKEKFNLKRGEEKEKRHHWGRKGLDSLKSLRGKKKKGL